jgi:DNA-binding winged helix-turn-helix (wHTH) protein
MKQSSGHVYKFGSFLLEERERRLISEGSQISLTPKAFDTLLLLVQHAGHILGKREMMEQMWPETFVEEATLAQNIFTLRRALGDDAANIKYIETIPRKGYRFVCKVEICDKDERGPVVAATNGELPVIAVLPFSALIRCEEEEYLSLGLADALVIKLSNLPQIAVRPTTSTRKYTAAPRDPVQIGRELSVDCVLTGSFQRAGGRIRATVQLVSVEKGAVVWSDKIDDVFTDVFSIQDMISEQFSRTFSLTLAEQEKTMLKQSPGADGDPE